MAIQSDTDSSGWPAYVTAGPFIFFSGQMGQARDGSFVTRYADAPNVGSRANTAFDWVSDMEAPVGAQGIAIYERYREILAKEGSDLGHFLRYHIYQRDKHFFSVFDRIRRTYEPKPPASTAVGMGRFEPGDRATLCIDSIALRASAEKRLGARTVLPGSAKHVAAATFSHVVSAGHFLFLAGQIPIDTSKPGSPLIRNYDDIPEEGRFLRVGRSHEDTRNGPIAAQTWFTYDLIRQHLEAVGSSMDQILNLIVYLQDIRDFPTFHRVHERFFKSRPPALTVVEVREVGHKGTLLEIEPTAILPAPGVERTVIEPQGWRAPAHMSAGVAADGLAFFLGVIGADESGRPVQLSESVRAKLNVAAEQTNGTAHALQTVAAISALTRRVAAANGKLDNIVHVTVYIDDISHFKSTKEALEHAFGERRPALTVLEVPAPAPVRGARVSLSAIAYLGERQ
ncbi:MAG: Rid family hydrolase [Burkholderiales bacterium]